MNLPQRIVVLIGMCVLIVAGLFPPWATYKYDLRTKQSVQTQVFYRPVFKFLGASGPRTFTEVDFISDEDMRDIGYLEFSSSILYRYLYIEFGLIILVTAGGVLLFSRKREAKP